MSDILQIFSGNPMSTFIGKKIEEATRPELDSEDWALNMEICDIINGNDDDARDAARAIKKRLHQIEQDRNFTITNRTLTVLETCVSNCSHRFHVLVMTKDFIQDLVKLIGPKNNPPIDLQERVLSLIERWAEAFRSQPDLIGVWSVYQDLKAKGVTFPQRDPSSHVPIQTPQRITQLTAVSQSQQRSSSTRLAENTQHSHPQQPPGQVILEGESYNKISQDLTIVQSSIDMLDDIMKVLESPQGEESDWKLAEDLSVTCRQMKTRVVELIERVANEDLTIQLLSVNDELNNTFTKYERLVKNNAKAQSSTTSSLPDPPRAGGSGLATRDEQTVEQASKSVGPKLPGVSSGTLHELSLIDFNAMSPADRAAATAAGQTTSAQQQIPKNSDPFDTSNVLAENLASLNLNTNRKTAIGEASKSSDKKPSGLPEEISSVREQDFAEIENWLSTDSGRNLNSISGDMPSIEPISIPNSEFENFIASRALAGSASTAITDQQQQQQHQTSTQKPKLDPSV